MEKPVTQYPEFSRIYFWVVHQGNVEYLFIFGERQFWKEDMISTRQV